MDVKALAQNLDARDHAGRVATIRSWSPKFQAELYEAVKGVRPLALEFLVPSGVAPLTEVIHEGKNTLPVFTQFQKRFTRLEGDVAPVGGYNHQAMAFITGPGCFVVDLGQGEHAGELAIDYTRLSKTKPAAWPAIRPNTGIGGLVYGGMIDYLRGVSTHVSIGRAFKAGKPINNWFGLTRHGP